MKNLKEYAETDLATLMGVSFGNPVFKISQHGLSDLAKPDDQNPVPQLNTVNGIVIGDSIKGKDEEGNEYTGEIIQKMEDHRGQIEYFVILDDKLQKNVKIIPATVSLVSDKGAIANETNNPIFEYKNIQSLSTWKSDGIK